jgi:hypothetical protein
MKITFFEQFQMTIPRVFLLHQISILLSYGPLVCVGSNCICFSSCSEGLGEGYDGDIAFASALESFGGGHNDPISLAFGGMSIRLCWKLVHLLWLLKWLLPWLFC